MLRPTGSLPPSVYWRRRLLLVGAALLIILTVYVLFIARDDKKKPASQQSRTAKPAATHSSSKASPSTNVVPCVPSVLGVAATTPQKKYRVGQQPELDIQVTNTGEAPCIADLSDGQIELLVYNGESRVWGSHDCQVEPGTSPMTLTPRQSVKRSIRWTGLSSQPHCAGGRMRVGAGSYTLRARFAGIEGRPANFSLSP
jgi:hypothetical protein